MRIIMLDREMMFFLQQRVHKRDVVKEEYEAAKNRFERAEKALLGDVSAACGEAIPEGLKITIRADEVIIEKYSEDEKNKETKITWSPWTKEDVNL